MTADNDYNQTILLKIQIAGSLNDIVLIRR